jgi:hypothetical protein
LDQQFNETSTFFVNECTTLWTVLRRQKKAHSFDKLENLLFRGILFQIVFGIARNKLADSACLIQWRSTSLRLFVFRMFVSQDRGKEAEEDKEDYKFHC